jgi:hypothetical protein
VKDLFQSISARSDRKFEVNMSMVEVYNEVTQSTDVVQRYHTYFINTECSQSTSRECL